MVEPSAVLVPLSKLIYETEKKLQSERFHPGYNPDVMDDALKQFEEAVVKLRVIRNELETLMAKLEQVRRS